MSEYYPVDRSEKIPIVEVTEPLRIISPEDAQVAAPEFNFPSEVEIVPVGQRQARFSKNREPLFTWGISQCTLEIVQTRNKPDQDPEKNGFIHVQSGNLDENEAGSKLPDIAEDISNLTTGIMVSGSNSISPRGITTELGEIGIVTIKHIEIDDHGTWVHVVYRPKTDEVLVKVGPADDFSVPIYVYQGFSDVPITDSIIEKSHSKKTAAAKRFAKEHLRHLYQNLLELLCAQKYPQAKHLFDEAKNYAKTHQIDWESLPITWHLIEQKFQQGTWSSLPHFSITQKPSSSD